MDRMTPCVPTNCSIQYYTIGNINSSSHNARSNAPKTLKTNIEPLIKQRLLPSRRSGQTLQKDGSLFCRVAKENWSIEHNLWTFGDGIR